jgi:hypothetical protein
MGKAEKRFNLFANEGYLNSRAIQVLNPHVRELDDDCPQK